MILYIEKQALNEKQTQEIIKKLPNYKIVLIDNYKNIFDKKTFIKSIIIAKLKSNCILEAPVWYWHTKSSYFFRTSLNCIYDCSYCYLKWAFKSEDIVIFTNYWDIKDEIFKKIDSLDKNKIHRFYSSDYSDILWMDFLTWFCYEFIPFFEQFKNVMMEIRTKSSNITPFLNLWFIPKNTEIAFSLNPQILIDKYEKKTSSLDNRIKAINKLLALWYKVWLRFLPLLPVKDYEVIYSDFINYIKQNIDISKIHSIFASWLLYTKKDYNKILSKYPDLDVLHMLELSQDNFYRESKNVRDTFYSMFKKLDKKCLLCLEN